MRLTPVLVPLGVSLAVAGGLLYYASIRPAAAAPPSVSSPSVIAEVRHPVSAEMLHKAALMSEKTAPFFKLKDIHDRTVQIGGAGSRPQFVYFILDGCPCSLDVQPLFNRLYLRYKDKIDFVGVINTANAKGVDYAGVNTVLHPIIGDEKLKIIKAYAARESTYSLLIRPNGTIVKMWPGYSQGILAEMNTLMAHLAKTPALPFDAAYAPKTIDSGCYFY